MTHQVWRPRASAVEWSRHSALCDAIRSKSLVLFIGNGLSRLADPPAPSWHELFSQPACRERFMREGIDLDLELRAGSSLLELAEVLRPDALAWQAFLGRVLLWQPMVANPTVVHSLLPKLNPLAVLTTNVDSLLDEVFHGRKVVYIHGSPDQPESWVFSQSAYESQTAKVTEQLQRALSRAGAVLFIGYGHSGDDFDIIEAIARSDRWQRPALFTLLSEGEEVGLRGFRIRRLGIQHIPYTLPKEPTRQDRLAALAVALQGLCLQTSCHLSDAIERTINDLCIPYEHRLESAALVIGLAGVNIISTAPETAPASSPVFPEHRRLSLARDETSEPGGPGFIVSRILSALNQPNLLVSRVAEDPEGDQVWAALARVRRSGQPLCMDLVERRAPTSAMQRTWRSYVLVHPVDGERNFLDRTVDREFLTVTDETVDAARKLRPQAIYFDRFLRGRIREFVAPIHDPLPDDTWLFYETGENGDRYSPHPYHFENEIAGKVNFALCSLNFASHFLASRQGKRPIQAINDVAVLVDDAVRQKAFLHAVAVGADAWMRTVGPRIVVVTLHSFGALWLDLRNGSCGHVSAASRGLVRSTASAGDTFRGSFMAAILKLRATQPNLPSVAVEQACTFATQASALKVVCLTLEEAIEPIQAEFRDWCTRAGL